MMIVGFPILSTIIAVVICCGSANAPYSDQKHQAELQILADKQVYSPGSIAHVKFILTNTSSGPLYFFRGMSECSSQIGTFSLLILDQHGHEANPSGCSMEVDLEHREIEKELRSNGIMLKPGEIYGAEVEFTLPSKKGNYRLMARLFPAALSKEQRETLALKGLSVLSGICEAPVVRVEIR